MTTMNQIQRCWEAGYLEGWKDQSTVANPPTPTILPFPCGISPVYQDPCKFAHDEGREAGRIDQAPVKARQRGAGRPMSPGRVQSVNPDC